MKELNFNSLKGKNVVVTGGSGALGRAICLGLSSIGANIVVLSRDSRGIESVIEGIKEKYKVKTIGITANVTDLDSIEEAKSIINKDFGSIDCLVNSAGGNSLQTDSEVEQILDSHDEILERLFFGQTIEHIRDNFELNFIGTLIPIHVFSDDMAKKGYGSIVNISSMTSVRTLTKVPGYSASKASANSFTQWLAVHLAEVGVRMNAIAPGFFIAKQNKYLLYDEDTNELTRRGRRIIDNTPLGRFGEPGEIVGITAFLLSDLSKFLTGTVIPVDGGYNAFGSV